VDLETLVERRTRWPLSSLPSFLLLYSRFFSAKRLHSAAQGRCAAAHPGFRWTHHARVIPWFQTLLGADVQALQSPNPISKVGTSLAQYIEADVLSNIRSGGRLQSLVGFTSGDSGLSCAVTANGTSNVPCRRAMRW